MQKNIILCFSGITLKTKNSYSITSIKSQLSNCPYYGYSAQEYRTTRSTNYMKGQLELC